ncbi:AzlD domain-containing protein [Bifidobacterium sp. ESL0763]|nr:AzlD domain-containing protein [Bifidobacterium sp. ESL0763]MDF7664002.1 AzlD domain-containing protein [Bifidobacterium sp. ESL0763]
MTMTVWQSIIIIAIVSLTTIFTRFAMFILFPESKIPPKFVRYLGDVLPPAITGMLVVYSLKDVTPFSGNHGAPEAIAVLVMVLFYRWRHNSLLAIFVGTILYMALVQTVFA